MTARKINPYAGPPPGVIPGVDPAEVDLLNEINGYPVITEDPALENDENG